MFFYFSSDFPAVIKLGGIYYGKLDRTVKHVNIDGDVPFIEICPTVANERSFNFFLDQEFLCSPPANVSVTDLKGGYLIKFERNLFFPQFKLIAQEKFPNALVTVFNENGLKISIETPNCFFIDTVPFITNSATIYNLNIDGKDCVAVFFNGEKNLVEVFSLSEKITKVFSRAVSSARFDCGLETEETFCDIAKHSVTSTWGFNQNSFIEKTRTVKKQKDFCLLDLNERIVPFAFLEELLVFGDVKEYLSTNLKDQSQKLYGFLGDFIGVFPPPIFRKIDEVGLIYPNGERKYKVEYFTFEIKNHLIYNIKKCDL